MMSSQEEFTIKIAKALEKLHPNHFIAKAQATFLAILTWSNLCFTELSTKILWNTKLAASDIFHMFTQSIKFF